jgi:hypothetical protein
MKMSFFSFSVPVHVYKKYFLGRRDPGYMGCHLNEEPLLA